MRLASPRPRRLLALAGSLLVLALGLHVAFGWRDAGPDPLPGSAEQRARAAAMGPAERVEELRQVIQLERAAQPAAGVPSQDPRLVEAAGRLAALAATGEPPAAYRLGWYLMNGWGLARDRCGATWWYDRAARAGEASAQFWLAMAYLPPNGQGVKPDKLRAFQWASAAVAQGQATAKQLFFFFTRDFSPEERRAAEASLLGWTAATAPAPEIRRFPYVPLLVGIWPRLTDDIIPCRQDEVPLEQWPEE